MLSSFFKRFLLLSVLLLLLGAAPLPAGGQAGPRFASGCEVRGVWLNAPAFDTPAHRAETLQKIQDANLNTVFMLAPPILGNRGWTDPDDFAQMLQDLAAVGVSAHIWVAAMYRQTGSPAPEADFRNPQEQAAQVAWADALLRAYPLADGYHLDYIRYSGAAPVNEGGRLDGVSATVAAVANHIETHFPNRHLTAAVFNLSPYGADFAAEDIPQWFLDWYAQNPGNPYDHPHYWYTTTVPYHFKKQQDPTSWMLESPITGVMPMEYTHDDDWWQQEVDHWRLFMDARGLAMTQVLMGVGWYDDDWADYDAPGVVRKIKYGRTQGVGGFVIFELGNPAADDSLLVNALAVDGPENDFDAPYELPAPSCLWLGETYLPLTVH